MMARLIVDRAEAYPHAGYWWMVLSVSGVGTESAKLIVLPDQKFLDADPGGLVLADGGERWNRRNSIAIREGEYGAASSFVVSGATKDPAVVQYAREFVLRVANGTIREGQISL